MREQHGLFKSSWLIYKLSQRIAIRNQILYVPVVYIHTMEMENVGYAVVKAGFVRSEARQGGRESRKRGTCCFSSVFFSFFFIIKGANETRPCMLFRRVTWPYHSLMINDGRDGAAPVQY
jgi:hypothetical protein